MGNEIEQIAQQNEMSIEFVTWFFNEKRVGCGNVWFMMMAAMWEGWKGRSVEMDKLAAENVALALENVAMKQIVDSVTNLDNEPQYHSEGMGCGLEDRGITDRYDACRYGWDEAMERVYGEVIPCADELDFSATDVYVAGIKADGVEEFVSNTVHKIFDESGAVSALAYLSLANSHVKQLREGAKRPSKPSSTCAVAPACSGSTNEILARYSLTFEPKSTSCATAAVWLSVLTSLLTSVRCRSLMPHFRLLCLTRHILSASARPRGWAKSTGA